MISQLELRGWRAYDHLKVAFEPGTTFVVARNGVGKTSMLQGAAFALFGERSGYASSASIRDDYVEASAAVTLLLSTGATVVIERTLTQRRSMLMVDGVPTAETEYEAALAKWFHADAASLARLTFLPAGSLRDYDTERLQLHRHLCRLFGVEQLQAVRDDIKALGTSARSELRKIKEIQRSSNAEIEAWQTELTTLNTQLDEVSRSAEAIRGELREAEATVRLAEAMEHYEARLAERDRALDGIRMQAAAQLGIEIAEDADIVAVLRQAEEDASERVGELERARGRLEGRLDVLENTRHQLDEANSDCPVCLRPLDATTREAATSAHDAHVDDLRHQLDPIVSELHALDGRRRGITTLSRAVASAPSLPERPQAVAAGQLEESEARVHSLTGRLTEVEDTIATLKASAAMLRKRLENEATNREQHQRAVLAFRREALVEAADVAVDEMVKRLIAGRINPLTAKVAARWKTIFKGTRPLLTLDASGELKLNRGNTVISFDDMSAGERAVALIVTRLLVLSSTAPQSFLWLDEPLEQLDPSNRRLMAQLLAATSSAGPRQLIVTTFEEHIARRLEQRVPNVHVQYVTADE